MLAETGPRAGAVGLFGALRVRPDCRTSSPAWSSERNPLSSAISPTPAAERSPSHRGERGCGIRSQRTALGAAHALRHRKVGGAVVHRCERARLVDHGPYAAPDRPGRHTVPSRPPPQCGRPRPRRPRRSRRHRRLLRALRRRRVGRTGRPLPGRRRPSAPGSTRRARGAAPEARTWEWRWARPSSGPPRRAAQRRGTATDR